MRKLSKCLLGCLVFIQNYGLNIKWNNNPITSEAEYDAFMEHIQQDPSFAEYLKIRDQIGAIASEQGVLISPYWGVFGAHFMGFNFDANGLDKSSRYFHNIKKNVAIEKSKAIKVLNTDLALMYIYSPRNGDQEIKDSALPILERVSIEDIRNPENKFYALSCALHGSNIPNSLTELDAKYYQIVKCKPTSGNPLTQAKLRFEIDDDANAPIEFRTTAGDSCQPFFLITPQGFIKLVGTYNPGGDSFSVENIAYPPTRAFIDNVILTDALEN